MTTPQSPPPVDIEELTRLAKAAGDLQPAWAGDTRVYGREFGRVVTPTLVLALLQELTELRAMKATVHELVQYAIGRNPQGAALAFDLNEIERVAR